MELYTSRSNISTPQIRWVNDEYNKRENVRKKPDKQLAAAKKQLQEYYNGYKPKKEFQMSTDQRNITCFY